MAEDDESQDSLLTRLSSVFVYVAIIGVFFLFLRELLRYARKKMDKAEPLPADDAFFKEHGYSFDYTFVFQVHGESDELKNSYQKRFTMRNVIDRLKHAQLDARFFFSVQRDEIYVKVRASLERLRQEASRANYRLLLDPLKLRTKANAGKRRKGTYVWKPIVIIDEHKVSRYNPYEYIYAAYDATAYEEGLYKLYHNMNGHKSIFRGVDRINLLLLIFEGKLSYGGSAPPGAGLNISKLVATKTVLAAFALHDFDELVALERRWLRLCAFPWDQPLVHVKNYFGERIGFYFLYLGHYVELLIVPAILGTIVFVVQQGTDEFEHPILPYFVGFMVVWSSFYVEMWKRRQSRAAMEWGSAGIEEEEQDRPLFEGIVIPSPATGREFTYFPTRTKTKRVNFAVSVTAALIVCVIAIVVAIYLFTFWISDPERSKQFTIRGLELAPLIGSGMNAVVIVASNLAYKMLAIKLTDYENHRTDTMYEDYLIGKVFLFQLVNSFSGLTYVAFIKTYIGLPCTNPTCTEDVGSSLSTIFLSQLLVRAITEIFVRKILTELKLKSETSGLPPGVKMTPIEEQYVLNEYQLIIGTLTDYAALTVQYGYTVLFVTAFTFAPAIALVSGYIQIRVDGWKLCQAVRRPQPKIAEDIGTWQTMIEIISMIGVIYNFLLLFFTGNYLKNVPWNMRWLTFIVVEHAAFGLKYLIGSSFSDVPLDVDIQLQRQEFIVSKVIEDQADEGDEDVPASDVEINFVVHQFDNDWVKPTPDDGTVASSGSSGKKGTMASAPGSPGGGGASKRGNDFTPEQIIDSS